MAAGEQPEMGDSMTIATPADVAKRDQPKADEKTPDEVEQAQEQRLPDDHSLVKAYAAQKDEIRALKAKAARLDEIEEASKSEAERAADRLAAAERRAAELEAANDRKAVVIEYGLTAEDEALLEGVSDSEVMRRIASRIQQRNREEATPRPPRPNPAQREGDSPADSKDAQARAFFGIS